LPETAGLPSSSISEASPVIRQEPVPGQDKAPHPLQTTCDNCEVNIPDVHYHCRLCRSDDYDIREICAEGGARCENQEHCLMKRTVSNKGNMTLLSTAALAPKVATHGFDAVKEFIKQLGLTTHPKDLPRSFLLAVAPSRKIRNDQAAALVPHRGAYVSNDYLATVCCDTQRSGDRGKPVAGSSR
jgi:hypothetical protein